MVADFGATKWAFFVVYMTTRAHIIDVNLFHVCGRLHVHGSDGTFGTYWQGPIPTIRLVHIIWNVISKNSQFLSGEMSAICFPYLKTVYCSYR